MPGNAVTLTLAPSCGIAVIEAYRPIRCNQPAAIRIYRPAELGGNLDVCARHMDLPDLYASVTAEGWRWRPIEVRGQ